MSVYYLVINNVAGKTAPIFLNTNFNASNSQKAQIQLFWKFESGKTASNPGP